MNETDQLNLPTEEIGDQSLKSIWRGELQAFKSYDNVECQLSMAILNSHLKDFDHAKVWEKATFISYCIANKLDPIRKQVYFIKYNQNDPASFVTSWEVFMQRAQRREEFDGMESGVVWEVFDDEEQSVGKRIRGKACDFELNNTTVFIVGGWARVYRKDRKLPFEVEVPWEEMVGKKRDGTTTKFWRSMPTTMAQKTPLSRALRQAFADDMGSLYTEFETEAFSNAQESQGLQSGEVTPPSELEDLVGEIDDRSVPLGVTDTVGDFEAMTAQAERELAEEQLVEPVSDSDPFVEED